MLQPQVTLKSGGYIIINQTEALVSIDVNSGRSTKEHSIEETALHTNLEAAEEVARQLRLRDLAGLIVIDFIDMEENRNNRAVEKRLKDHLKNDRARIQLGRISHFGLMEMSRQRIRASVLESTMKPCPHCGGTGHVRSDSSVALLVVRAIEEFLLKDSRSHIIVKTPASTALYVLNHKRSTLSELEARFGLTITIEVDETVGAQHYVIQRGAIAEKPHGFQEQQFLPPLPGRGGGRRSRRGRGRREPGRAASAAAAAASRGRRRGRPSRPQAPPPAQAAWRPRPRPARRSARWRRRKLEPHAALPRFQFAASESDDRGRDRSRPGMQASEDAVAEDRGSIRRRAGKKRRRGKRGGKRNRREDADGVEEVRRKPATCRSDEPVTPAEVMAEEIVEASVTEEAGEPEAAAVVEPPKKPRRASRAKKVVAEEAVAQTPDEPVAAAAEPEEAANPSRRVGQPATEQDNESARASRRKPADSEPAVAVVSSTPPEGQSEPASDQPKRSGWWQRKSFF